MKTSGLITEDNLIGSIASIILQLGKIKNGLEPANSIDSSIELIVFLQEANKTENKGLLYESKFIISEDHLETLHEDLQLLKNIDLEKLKRDLVVISQNPKEEEILKAMRMLKEIAKGLWQNRKKSQIYM